MLNTIQFYLEYFKAVVKELFNPKPPFPPGMV